MGTVVGKDAEIERLYRSELSVSRIAHELGVSITAVARKLDRLGLRERATNKVVPEAVRGVIARLYETKVPVLEIRKRFHVSRATVLKIAQ